MKKLILLIFIFILTTGIPVNSEAVPELHDKDLIAENAYLRLYINRHDTSLAIKSKESGKIWFTNPLDRDQARGGLRERLSSQLNIIHDPNRVQKENYIYSNQFEQFELNEIDNGVRVDYRFVEDWAADDYLPRLISEDRFEENILNHLGEEDKEEIRSRYNLIKLKELE